MKGYINILILLLILILICFVYRSNFICESFEIGEDKIHISNNLFLTGEKTRCGPPSPTPSRNPSPDIQRSSRSPRYVDIKGAYECKKDAMIQESWSEDCESRRSNNNIYNDINKNNYNKWINSNKCDTELHYTQSLLAKLTGTNGYLSCNCYNGREYEDFSDQCDAISSELGGCDCRGNQEYGDKIRDGLCVTAGSFDPQHSNVDIPPSCGNDC